MSTPPSSGSPTPSISASPAVPSPSFSSLMARAPTEDNDTSSASHHNGTPTPTQPSVELPRPGQTNDRAGCWTCRIRRKRCDLERLDGNSCRTCHRLTIECLGWGARRPEWMRNKQAVDDYKAGIKAQLTRKGLIRGQPRSTMQAAQAAASGGSGVGGSSVGATTTRTSRRSRASNASSSTTSRSPNLEISTGFPGQNHDSMLPGTSSSRLYPTDGSFSDNTTLDLNTSYFSSSPLPPPSALSPPFSTEEPSVFNDLSISGTSPSSSTHSQQSLLTPNLGIGSSTGLGFGGGFGGVVGGGVGYDFNGGDLQTVPDIPILSGQNSIQEGHVMYYFENIRRTHCMLANHHIMNTTFELIVQDPRGALTNAVCALANLQYTRLRVAQGLEAPDPNPEHSTAKYFYDEAYFQLANAKQLRGSYTETDVLAALHLVCYSQLSGGSTEWQLILHIVFDWIAQLGLLNDDNPSITLGMMNLPTQLGVKCTMMIDIISSLTLMRPPRYSNLYQRLLSWTDNSILLQPGGMQMDILTGCPDEAWLAIAEVSGLAFWKATEERKGSLSLRELVRRGDDIERRLRSNINTATTFHQNTPDLSHTQNTYLGNVETTLLSDEVKRVIANIFRETALLYLHTVVNSPSPGVHEISSSVDNLVGMIRQLAPSELDRTLVFPICLAGSMSDNSMHRDFLKGRLQGLDETIGNIMKTRFLMEGVWQRRDVRGDHVDWREMMGDRSINLLLI